jgi:signal transduction histidine kinase
MRLSMVNPPAAAVSIVGLLASTDHLAELVDALHARAVAACGASVSVLLELEAGSDRLRPTSATGLDDLSTDAWLAGPTDAALVAEVLAHGHVRLIAPLSVLSPELTARLRTPAAVMAPVVSSGAPIGLLVLGLPQIRPALEWSGMVTECADAFAVALTRARVRQDGALQQGLHDLVVALGRSGEPRLPADRLDGFCTDVARLFAADRVEVWSHDRKARRLDLAATSDRPRRTRAEHVSTADAAHRVALAMRHPRAGLIDTAPDGSSNGVVAVVPLRGRRRALGALMVERIRISPGDEARVLDRLDSLGYQLSNLLESAQLLDDVQRAHRELENTFDSMQDLVLVIGRDLCVTRVNDAAARRLGRPRASLESCAVSELVGEPLATWLTNRAASGQPREAQTTELDDARLGGTLRVTMTPLVTGERNLAGSVLVARDVSDERRLEADRAALREQLAQSEALSQLVAGIAHELNNPLQAVLGHVELVCRTERLSPRAVAQLRLVARESNRAARIVRNLLLLAGSGKVERRPVSVHAALRRAIALRTASCRRAGISIERHLAEELPKVSGDGLLLQQAFHNIIMNAEQAMTESGGTLEVRSAYAGPQSQVSIAIRDTGPGVAPDMLPRIFDPFFTTKDAGSGLGLALALRIVREHGGDIVAANDQGGGAVFTVHLPAPTVIK